MESGLKFQMGEAEVNRDAARFFLGQPVGVDAGQRFDQGAFAMVHVTGGGHDEMPDRHRVKARR
jgi:hypothetical protein